MSKEFLTGKQPAFVVAYVDNELAGGKLTPSEVALRAGVAPKNAVAYASLNLSRAIVQKAIADRKLELLTPIAEQLGVDAKRVLQEWFAVALGDPTEIVGVRRLNCRHCWGIGYSYQYTDAEYARGTAEALQQMEPLDKWDGGNGFLVVRDPNPSCPECGGEGVEDVHVRDFRKLTDAQRRLIAGVKQGKHGIEVTFRDRDAAWTTIAKHLGLLVERKELSGPNGGPIQTANVNYTLPTDPLEAAKAYQQLMEGK